MIDTVVLGLGAVGSFALRAVAKDDNGSVVGIERFSRGHAKGSSHGKSRVYRRAYFEHPSYVPWCEFSVQEFFKLQKEQKVPIIKQCGILMAVPQDNAKLKDQAVAAAKEHDIEIEEIATTQQLRERYPQFNFPDKYIGIYEPGGGFVRPENAIIAALKDAEQHGATIMEETIVKSIKEIRDDDGEIRFVEIAIDSRERGEEIIRARNVLVAAGAWTSELLPSYAKHLTVTRQLQAWVDTSSCEDSSIYDGSTMPATALVLDGLSTPIIYTLPADDEASELDPYRNCVKMGIHCRKCPIDPNINYTTAVTPEEKEEMQNAIAAGFCKEVSSQSIKEIRACMYSMTADENFIIGSPKEYERVCAIAGLSGHGFKMAPALGQMLADFASGKGIETWKADFCSPRRFDL